jgi:hypothetical protein
LLTLVQLAEYAPVLLALGTVSVGTAGTAGIETVIVDVAV